MAQVKQFWLSQKSQYYLNHIFLLKIFGGENYLNFMFT